MARPEANLIRKSIKRLKAAFPRSYIVKISDRATRGIPDVLAIVRWDHQHKLQSPAVFDDFTVFMFLEFKTPVGVVSPIQQNTLDTLRDLHEPRDAMRSPMITLVIRFPEQIEEIIKAIQKGDFNDIDKLQRDLDPRKPTSRQSPRPSRSRVSTRGDRSPKKVRQSKKGLVASTNSTER